ncbi:MAG: ferritin-like domain-containing protein [Candidatus Melainabacteria bacterium]|nr:ferritin-like domain-containing protein [Candidatus Melainabacteria bacterium]
MTKAVISVLNSLLMEEVTAAEAYKQVLERLPSLDIKAELEELHIAHSKRAQKLKKRLRELSSTPAQKLSRKPSMDVVFSGAADDLPMRILMFFENLESSVLSLYEASLSELDNLSLSMVRSDLIPEQDVTHNVVYTLKSAMVPLAKSA